MPASVGRFVQSCDRSQFVATHKVDDLVPTQIDKVVQLWRDRSIDVVLPLALWVEFSAQKRAKRFVVFKQVGSVRLNVMILAHL